jgi:RNA polymerase sigma-70 factor (family 1)
VKMKEDNTMFSKTDRDAQELFLAFFSSYYGILCSFAYKYIAERDEAEDIAQESFIALWQNRHKMQNEDQAKAFLFLTVKNKCINVLKHFRVREKYLKETEEEDPGYFFEEQMVFAEVIAELKRTISELPPKRQKIVVLSLDGLHNDEIATQMKISVNTVKLQKKIAYRYLREKLKNSLFLLFIV